MKKIITALAEPQLNNELKKEKDFIVIGKDIQYQEGVIEILETEKEVDFLIISETLPGNEKIESLIEKIKQINNEVNIVIILENKKEELEKNLYSKNVYLILYNKIEIKEIIKLIKNKKEDENEKIKKEINDLKKIIIEQNSKNKQNKKQKIKEVKELNSQKEIICILGSGGVGKSIFTVNLAKSLIYSKKKILIIDFDILNNSLHTILGVKKYSEKISKKIKENNLIDKKGTILDVGCGAGKYSIALSDDCFKIVGTDLSPKMIESAQKRAKEYEKTNIEFRCDDWSKLDIKKEGMIHQFDLVIACMTPAICNYDTFKKFIDCSKNAGIFCSGTRRSDSVTDEIDKILGINKQESKSEKSVLYVFNILWENGYYPNVEYIDQSWDSERTLENAYEVYINRCKAKYDIDNIQEKKVKQYLKDISQNGVVYEKIKAKKAVVYWKK